MKLHCIAIGRNSIPYVDDGVALYTARLRRYCDFAFRIVETPKTWGRLPASELTRREGELLLELLPSYGAVYLLDERGEQPTSPGLASLLERRLSHGPSQVAFVIGGAYGISGAVKEAYRECLSLSRLTFSHQLVRIILLEQLYRAFTILRGEPYHHA